MRQIRSCLPSLTAGIVASLLTIPAWAVTFTPTNLMTDDQFAHAAQITDTGLKNVGNVLCSWRALLGLFEWWRNNPFVWCESSNTGNCPAILDSFGGG
ncbi:MAG: hypothetical protein ABS69_12835 [Nitrosomonadales bacterium SCN 54-20]|nr:MAG: hypothetical protein ABS69_12835 [Nitrosomonadales bacterium SCN 54-20]